MMRYSTLILADDPPAKDGKSPALYDYSLLFLLPLLFIFLIVLPARRDRKQRQAMLSAVDKGARVVVGGGIVGVVDKVERGDAGEDELLIKIDPNANVRLRVLRGSISRVLPADKKDVKDNA
jgi:preprotein translocase subunit YajC